MIETLQEILHRQREALPMLFDVPLRSLARDAVRVWFNRELLDRVMSEGIGGLPHCDLVYAIDMSGIQVSSNIHRHSTATCAYGQDLSRRPYLITMPLLTNTAFKGTFLCDAYISQVTRRPCLTVMCGVTSGPETLGFIAADFDLRDLPSLNLSIEEPPDWQQIRGDPAAVTAQRLDHQAGMTGTYESAKRGCIKAPGNSIRFMAVLSATVLLAAGLYFVSVCAVAGHPHGDQHTHTVANGLPLSQTLGKLIREEMAAIQEGMQSLLPAIVSGNWTAVAATGEQLRDSYILQQELTPDLLTELRQAPVSFRELDRSFHHSADMLAQAAKMKNPDVVAFYYYKLTDTCVSCHTRFAAHRFPGLVNSDRQESHQH